MMKRIFLLSAFLFLVIITMSSAFAAPSFQAHGETIDGNASVGDTRGFKIRVGDQNLTNITVSENAQSTGNRAYIMTGAFSQIAEATVNLTTRNASFPTVNLTAHTNYYVVINNSGGAYTTGFYNSPPFNISNVYLNWTGGYVGGDNPNAANVLGIWVEPINYTQAGPNIITTSLTNAVNGSTINTVALSNVTGNLTFLFFNITGAGYCVSYSGNGTGTNCSTGNGASTYFNKTVTTTIIGTQGVTATTYQAHINLSAYRLFLNTSITSFLATNNINISDGVLIPANNGSNNIKVDVPGNYSKNVTCTVTAPLNTFYCNATGIFDNLYTIGAKFVSTNINNFTVTVANATLGGDLYRVSTVNGSIVFPLIIGYNYYFTINSTAHSLNNATLNVNASTHLFNFSLLSYNTFELNFFNESTGLPINNATISVQLISDLYSQNYTTGNGSLLVTALTPEEYTIRYWREPEVPREYYVTLTNQSYNNISLFLIDSGISQLYLPVVNNQYTRPIGGAIVQLLRAYINQDNTLSYKVVEMTTTDTNGQGVLRVQPNIINYKLLISNNGVSFTTDPTKFTASTNAYTLSDAQSVLSSLAGLPYIYTNVTYITGTQTFVFTWSDTQNLVETGCLIVTKKNNTGINQVHNSCSSGSTGSIPYTVTDTGNFTTYSAVGQLHTNTEFSVYTIGPVTIETGTATAATIFGLVGFIIMLLLVTSVGFMANEHGSDSMVIASLFAFVFVGMVGIIAFSWPAYIGIIILGILIVYKLSRR